MRVSVTFRLRQRACRTAHAASQSTMPLVVTPESGPVGFPKIIALPAAADLSPMKEAIFGLAMMKELAHHGYRIGPGTLYPLLHGLEEAGLLKAVEASGGDRRRMYRITAAGRTALDKARDKVYELHHEHHEVRPRKVSVSIKRRR